MCEEYSLTDFDGNIQAFMDACYQAYLDFWNKSPTFQGKRLQRNKREENGKEKDFWGMVEGHKDVEIDIRRYEKAPLLGHVINEANVSAKQDVLYFKRLHNRKVRIEVFSLSKQFLVVLQEIGKHDRVQFITAHPLSNRQLQKKVKSHKEFVKNRETPL